MKQLNMNGKLITGPVIFRENFNPVEFLYQKESACGFVYHNLAPISPVAFYHAEVMTEAIFKKGKEISLLNHFAYANDDAALFDMSEDMRKFIKEKLSTDSFKALTEQVWMISKETKLNKDDRNRLFMILTAGYALAVKRPIDCPITPYEAEAAYKKETVAETFDDGWFTFEDKVETAVKARKTPYKILLCGDAEKKLSENKSLRIKIRKILARGDEQNSSLPVMLEIYAHPEDKNPKHIEIEPGQSIFTNFLGNEPVYFHAKYSETDKGIAKTENNHVVFTDKSTGKTETKSFFGDKELICAHAEQTNSGYIALLRGMVYYDRYSNFAACTGMPQISIVEIAFKGDNLYFLNSMGFVSAYNGSASKKSTKQFGSIGNYLSSNEGKNR